MPRLDWLPEDVELLRDVSAAGWVLHGLRPIGKGDVRVESLVPPAFEAYGRVLHEVTDEGARRRVLWAELAERRGVELRPDTRLEGVLPAAGHPHSISAEMGSLGPEEAGTLAAILRRHTTSSESYFGVWEGFGSWWSTGHGVLMASASPVPRAGRPLRALFRGGRGRRARAGTSQDGLLNATPRMRTEDRAYFLFRGTFDSAASFDIGGLQQQSPNVWWPEDRAWFVVSEIDARSTYVGASRRCIDDLLATSDLETIEVSPTARIG